MVFRRKAVTGFILTVTIAFVVIVSVEIGWADSIWKSASKQPSSLYSTTKGEYKIGDIITIMILDSFSASTSASTSTDKESEKQLQFEGFEDILGMTYVFGQPIDMNPGFGLDAQNEFDGSGSSRRSSTVTGTITGQITEIISNGNLRIEAMQTTVINGEKSSVILVGTVRPQDISAQNTVLSTQVANAEIRYSGKGPLSNVQKRGIITEFIEFIWPF